MELLFREAAEQLMHRLDLLDLRLCQGVVSVLLQVAHRIVGMRDERKQSVAGGRRKRVIRWREQDCFLLQRVVARLAHLLKAVLRSIQYHLLTALSNTRVHGTHFVRFPNNLLLSHQVATNSRNNPMPMLPNAVTLQVHTLHPSNSDHANVLIQYLEHLIRRLLVILLPLQHARKLSHGTTCLHFRVTVQRLQ